MLSLSRSPLKTYPQKFYPLTRLSEKVSVNSSFHSSTLDNRIQNLNQDLTFPTQTSCNLIDKQMKSLNIDTDRYQTLSLEFYNGTFIITINRPDKRNALNRDVIYELRCIIEEIYINSLIKTVIITGAGDKAFVAGADISELDKLDSESAVKLARKVQALFNKIENCPKAVIAAVNGFALGGGCELALACPYIIASDNAKFGLPEAALGLIPGYGGTQRLTQRVGRGKAFDMMATAGMIDACEAKNLGLVNDVVPAADLKDKAIQKAQEIQKMAPRAISKIIECVNDAARGDPAGFDNEIERFGELFTTNDAREGVNAFLTKRKAVFTGE